MKLLKRLFMEEDGVTMIEYVLIAALIAIVAIVGTRLAGVEVENMFRYIADQLSGATE